MEPTMHIEDPNTPEPTESVAPEVPAPESTDDALLAALDEGVVAATPEAPEQPAEVPEPEAPAPEPVAEAAAPEPRPSDEFGTLPENAKAETRERFEKMREAYDAQHREVATLRDTLKAAGIEDVAKLPALAKAAKDANDLIGMVSDTGADAEQFGLTLDYLSLVNKAVKGDVGAAQKALAIWRREGEQLAALAGEEVQGIHDPIAAHADLVAAIEQGDMTRKAAGEVARARQTLALRQAADTQSASVQTAEQAQTAGRNALVAFDQQMTAADPHYAAKRPALNEMVSFIRQTLPPDKWLAATQAAYAKIPAPVVAAPAPPQPRVPVGPVRPSGPRPTMAPVPDDPMEALNMGLAAVAQR
jgi:hypothetical protein